MGADEAEAGIEIVVCLPSGRASVISTRGDATVKSLKVAVQNELLQVGCDFIPFETPFELTQKSWSSELV